MSTPVAAGMWVSLVCGFLTTEPAGTDMSSTFKKLTSCGACTSAGYGWCPMQRKCGGFANKECGVGERYYAYGLGPTKASKPTRKQSSPPPPPPSGTDMRSTFARLRTCDSCVSAGYGWCPNLRKCGGFANKRCGIGPNYISSAPEPAPQARSGTAQAEPRNGLWKSKSAREEQVEAEAEAVVPDVSPPPAASLLYAGPVKVAVAADAATAVEPSTTTILAAHLSNETSRLERSTLEQMPVAALVDKILELHSENLALRTV